MSKIKAKELINNQRPDFKILTYSKMYEGYKIIVRVIGEIWDYFVVINGEIYNATNVYYIPEKDRIAGKYYIKESFELYLNTMMSMAMATVDTIALHKKQIKTKKTKKTNV